MAATLDICAPADQTEGTRSQVLRWLKAVGDTVTQHEPLIELETDKVTVEVPAPASGVLREIVKAEQEEIGPGEVLGRLETSAESAPTSELAARSAGAAGTVERSTGAVSAQAGHGGAGSESSARASSSLATPADASTHAASGASLRLSPAVRRLLQERGLDASMIRGTGEGGSITVDDVAGFDAAKQADDKVPTVRAEQDSVARSSEPPAPIDPRSHAVPPAPRGNRSRSVPHTAVRKRIADHMVQSLLQTAPHVTTVFEADLTAVMAHRLAHRAEFQERGAPLTLTAYFLAAIVGAIEAVPEANSRWTDTALEIYDDIHIGVATAVEGAGLLVPVVRNVQSLDLFGIASRLDQLVRAAREGHLEPADVRGGTFTISNHGVSGSLLAAPIVINQPQSAILGVGKVEKRAVIIEAGDEEKVVARSKCYVTLTIDHRVMDGHQANRFLQTFVRTLESWPRDA
jgi:2-oxoglutarate dehydrogenase E2 component (dihydrolipoamide succinyltransferase)